MIPLMLISDNMEIRDLVDLCLQKNSIKINAHFFSLKEAIDKVKKKNYNIILWDLEPSSPNPEKILEEWRDLNPFLNVILLVEKSSQEWIVKALRKGIVDFFIKPFHDLEAFIVVLEELEKKISRWKKDLPFL